MEEYSIAQHLFGLTATDMSEVAMNSVKMSSFSDSVKASWLGPVCAVLAVVAVLSECLSVTVSARFGDSISTTSTCNVHSFACILFHICGVVRPAQNHTKPGVLGNDIHWSNVSNIRVLYREECLRRELNLLSLATSKAVIAPTSPFPMQHPVADGSWRCDLESLQFLANRHLKEADSDTE